MSDGRGRKEILGGMDFVISGPQADMPAATVGVATGPAAAGQFMMNSNVYNVSVGRLVGGTVGMEARYKAICRHFAESIYNQQKTPMPSAQSL